MQLKLAILSLLTFTDTSILTAARALDPIGTVPVSPNPRTTPSSFKPLEERCVNPVCTPGRPCPEYRCGPTIPVYSTTTSTAHCVNPSCTPGEICPLYRCATPTPTPITGCVNPVCTPGEECPDYRCADPESLRKESQNGSTAKSSSSPLWKIETIPKKGKGLIATHDITPGTLLLSESPLLTTEEVTTIDPQVQETQLSQKFSTLPQSSQKAFLALHNNFEDDKPLSGIVRSNGYPLGPGAEVGGVFETISRINHSCRPNVVQSWNPLLEQETVYAVRNIPVGEEICTAYHVGGPSTERQQILKTYFGFTCTCALCSLPEDELKASDERMLEAEELDETIGDSKKVRFHAAEVLACCYRLSRIYEVEGIKDDRLSRLYFDAFQVCNMHGDLARARVFAKQYCSAKKMAAGDCEGFWEMKPFVKNPKKHESFGVTELWKTGVEEVPKGLGRREFEKWLWREAA